MRVRTVIVVTALLSSILGAVAAYLVLTVPNDIQAAALMKTARKQMAAGQYDRARQLLSRIVQQYPRTDAAAAATVALATLADNEQKKLAADLTAQQRQIAALEQKVDALAARPIPQPAVVQAPAKKAPAKKAGTRRKTARRRR